MPGRFSIYQANRTLNSVLRGEPYTLPTTLWLALLTAVSDTPIRTNLLASAGEVPTVGTGYTRLAIGGANPLVFTQSTVASSKASDVVLWPTAIASWGIVTYVAVMDAETDGNVILYGSLQTPKTIDVGDTFRLPADSLVITM